LPSAGRAICGFGVTLAVLFALPAAHRTDPTMLLDRDEEGRDVRLQPTHRPTVEAAFAHESYARGELARLVIWTRGDRTVLDVFRAGTENVSINPRDLMLGSPVVTGRRIGTVRNGDSIGVRIGAWPSGLYFARLTAGTKIGYAPFVLRPRRLGEHSVAVVFPTMTWQAYNFHDDDRDGDPDTWYQDQNDPTRTARINRPYENRGVIPHYKYYDQPFVRWIVAKHPDVDCLADADLDNPVTTGKKLAAAYDLIIFPGHHEYVTRHEYDVVKAYRDRGGNLIFLSANNFYYRTIKHGNVMRRVGRWRDLGRPEAALVGTAYFDNDSGEHRGAWVIRRTAVARWLFNGTALGAGSRFASGGIEADETGPNSPRGTTVVAEIPNIFGTGHSAQMTYYETRNGAKVFAAGAFTLAGAAWWKDVRQLMDNLWNHMAEDAR
jgi:N,N-dimethylformamidase beta subunit-like protein